MIDLAQRKDPFITQSIEANYYDNSNGLNFNQANFKFAIGVVGYDGQIKDDPRYVKYYASIVNRKNGPNSWFFEKVIPVHKCTQEDFD